MTSSRHSLTALGDDLSKRYDDVFFRGEVATLRQQVSVLHDTLLRYMTKTDKLLSEQAKEQKRLTAMVTRLERHAKLPPLARSSSSSSPSKKASCTIDLPQTLELARETLDATAGISEGEKAPTGSVSYSVLDQNGNATELVVVAHVDGSLTGMQSGLPLSEAAEQNPEIDEEQDIDDQDYDSDYREESEELGAATAVSEVATSGPSGRTRRTKVVKAGTVDWEQLEGESKKNIGKPERKGRDGKVSGRLGQGSPAWAHYLRMALQRTLGDTAMFRYAREGARVFKAEKEEAFNEIKDRVVDFCKRNDLLAPEDKLMDDIAWAFLRNKKRRRGKAK